MNTHGDSRIDVIATHLSPGELASWYRSLDAYVNASAGEDLVCTFSKRGVRRAADLFDFRRRRPFFDSRVGYEVRFRPVGAWNSVYRGTWSDPDESDIIARMNQVVREPDAAKRLGIAAAERAAKFRWEDTIRKLVIVLIQNRFITCWRPG